ncbi:MAG: hypothetical protein ACOYB3_00805 [Azonexus sp.]
MKKPEELFDLLEELREEITRPSASYENGARVAVYIGRGQMNITAADAVFLLDNADTVGRFYEAIGSPDDCGIELYGFDIEEDVKSALDAHFSTVDEV